MRRTLQLALSAGFAAILGLASAPASAQSCCIGEVCFALDAATCATRGGSSQPSCTPYPCSGSAPSGACCTRDGCAVGTEQACRDFGGAYLGDDVVCTSNLCLTAGACCAAGCRSLLPLDCAAARGNLVGSATTCAPDPCTTGACCMFTGPLPSCQVQSRSECQLNRGVYGGNGTACDPGRCNIGACCAADGTCAETSSGSCRASGRLYHGDFTNCADATQCALAACCTPGACEIKTAITCSRIGGSLNPEPTCSPDPCLATCALHRNDPDITFPPLLPARSGPWVYTLACTGSDPRLSRLHDAAPANGRDQGPAAGAGGGELLLYQLSCGCAATTRVCLVKDAATSQRVILQFCP